MAFKPINQVAYASSRVSPEGPTPSFGEVIHANLGVSYGAGLTHLFRPMRFRKNFQEAFNPASVMTDEQRPHAAYLFEARSPEEYNYRWATIQLQTKYRNTLSHTPFWKQFSAALFDPINFLPIPLLGGGASVGRKALSIGVASAALEGTRELAVRPKDPLGSWEESVIATGGAFFAGTILGGIGAGIGHAAAASRGRTLADIRNHINASSRPIHDLTKAEIDAKGPREERTFAHMDDKELEVFRLKLLGEGGAGEGLDIDLDLKKVSGRFVDAEGKDLTAKVEAIELEQSIRRMEDFDPKNPSGDKDDMFGLESNWFTDSFLYKALPSPMKAILQGDNIPTSVKHIALKIASDSSQMTRSVQWGYKSIDSIFLRNKALEGEYVVHYDRLVDLWGKSTGEGVVKPLDYNLSNIGKRLTKGETFGDWLEGIERIRQSSESLEVSGLKGERLEAARMIEDFYAVWRDRLVDTGLLGDALKIKKKLEAVTDDLATARKHLGSLEKSGARKAELVVQRAVVDSLEKSENWFKKKLADYKKSPMNPANDFNYGARFWKVSSILKRRGELVGILSKWYKDNPEAWVLKEQDGIAFYEKTKLDEGDDAIKSRVEAMVDKLLGIEDDLGKVLDDGTADPTLTPLAAHRGKPRELHHRSVDIPNRLVLDFIEMNPLQVMRTYQQQIGPRYEFAKMFDGKNYEELVDFIRTEMAGSPKRDVDKAVKNITHLYDRVVGTVLERPDALNQRVANTLRDVTSFTYLGASGFTTLPEVGRILMEHGFGTQGKAIFGMITNDKVRLSSKEGRLAGEILEIVLGSSWLRMADEISNNPFGGQKMNRVKDVFYAANLLSITTRILKQVNSISMSHTIIDYSLKLKAGKESPMEKIYLARHGIDLEGAKRILSQPYETTESGLHLANTEAWTDLTARKEFRSALASNIGNVVIMGTPADKPIITDGIAYVPMHVAEKFGMKEDPRVRGYARVENGLLGLPFQFYSYVFGALNKTTALMAHDQVKSRGFGTMAMLGLGYWLLQIKTPDYIMDKMSWSDRFARAFDYSGVAALHSDAFYTSLSTIAALGGPNITGNILSAKYPQDKNLLDAFTGIAGAGPSYLAGIGEGAFDLVTGETGRGAQRLARSLPMSGLWFLKDEFNAITRGFGRN